MSAEHNPDSKMVICGELISSLAVVNLYLGRTDAKTYGNSNKRQHPTVTDHSKTLKDLNSSLIRKITCGRQRITLELDRRHLDDTAELYSVSLPPSISLLPDTCSGVVHTPHGWLLRFNFQQDAETGPANGISTMKPEPSFKLVCSACDHQLLRPEVRIRSSVKVSSLGLPAGMDWERTSLSYFCHEHEDEDHSGGNVAVPQRAAFVPQDSEVFVADAYYVVGAGALDPYGGVQLGPEPSDVHCGRCRLQLGKSVADAIQLWIDAVTKVEVDGVRGPDRAVESFVSECGKSSRRIALYSEEKHLEDRLMLLWFMDKNLNIFSAHLALPIEEGSVPVAEAKVVCKVLYQYSAGNAPVCKQWKSDPTVKLVKISERMLMKLATTLVASTERMPRAWRYANDFMVGYLPSCS